jgi:phage/conjugal plasmid C-4 type zinc finger TraR family protein
MNNKDDFEYNNEEEAEMAQLHSIHLHMNAVADVRRKLEKQAEQPSLEECEDCGEDIPQARREAIKGVTRCITCQELLDKRKKLYGA